MPVCLPAASWCHSFSTVFQTIRTVYCPPYFGRAGTLQADVTLSSVLTPPPIANCPLTERETQLFVLYSLQSVILVYSIKRRYKSSCKACYYYVYHAVFRWRRQITTLNRHRDSLTQEGCWHWLIAYATYIGYNRMCVHLHNRPIVQRT